MERYNGIFFFSGSNWFNCNTKRKFNADTNYFGEPVYTYSLKDGIKDGFLTPFKVKRIQTTMDEYVYTGDDDILAGEGDNGG